MTTEPVSRRIAGIAATLGPALQFFTTSAWAHHQGDPGIADFALGNPHEMPLPAFANALKHWSAPQNKDWFAYTNSEPTAQALVAQTLRERYSVAFEAQDIFMTNGAFAAIAAALAAIVDPGDQVIFISPPWFFYEALIVSAGAQAVRVSADRSPSISTWMQSLLQSPNEPARLSLTRRTTQPAGSTRPKHSSSLLPFCPQRQSATVARSTCSPMKPTAGSSSTTGISIAQPRSTPTRCCSTPMARYC